MKPPHQPLRVFLVEDIEVIRVNLTIALAEVSNALVVASAEGEAQATAWLASHPDTWDLAVVDLFLKQGSGLGVLRACRARPSAQQAVILTNYATPAMRERCLEAGADAVFDKSTELDELLAYCANRRRIAGD